MSFQQRTIMAVLVGTMLLISASSMAQTVWKKQVDSAGHFKSRELTSTSRHDDTIIVRKDEVDSTGKLITTTTSYYTLVRWDTIHHHDGLGVGITSPFFIDIGYSHAVSERFSVGGGLLASPNGSIGAYISSAFDLGLRSRVRFFIEPMFTYFAARESHDTTVTTGNLMNGTFHYNDSTLHASGNIFGAGISFGMFWPLSNNIGLSIAAGGIYYSYSGTESTNPLFMMRLLKGIQPLETASVGYVW